jgi:GNAT superfamily N-acetyltransferase
MTDIIFRRAEEADLPQIVAMLADNPLGAAREEPSPPLQSGYIAAFMIIDSNPSQMLVVAEVGGVAVGTLQMHFVAGIARQGTRRAIIECVHVVAEWRGPGLSGQMVEWSIAEARRRGCGIVQLVVEALQDDVTSSYERLGFKATQVGMILEI